MQYLCIQTGWAPPPVCGPPTVFCAMKPCSQPFQGRDTAPIQNPDHYQILGLAKRKHASTTRLPTPNPPACHSQPQGYLRTTGDSLGDGQGGGPPLSLLQFHSWDLLPSQGLPRLALLPPSHLVLFSRGPARN